MPSIANASCRLDFFASSCQELKKRAPRLNCSTSPSALRVSSQSSIRSASQPPIREDYQQPIHFMTATAFWTLNVSWFRDTQTPPSITHLVILPTPAPSLRACHAATRALYLRPVRWLGPPIDRIHVPVVLEFRGPILCACVISR